MEKRRSMQDRMKTCCGWLEGSRRKARINAMDLMMEGICRKPSEAVIFLRES